MSKDYITVEWNESEYDIKVEYVNELTRGAKGQYIPELKKILLLHNVDDSTIYHESIHATIDMFKSTDESFDAMFYDKINYGEEGFCHYVCEIAKKIKEMR